MKFGMDWNVEMDPQINAKKSQDCFETPKKTIVSELTDSTEKGVHQDDKIIGSKAGNENPHMQPWSKPSWATIVKNGARAPPPGFDPKVQKP